MTQHLVLTIQLHEQRYHGTSEWPPAPARVFQALLAGVACGETLVANARLALEWLEELPPPTIAAPRARLGRRVELFVPNNDLDTVGGNPDRVSEIRTKKLVQPYLLDGVSLTYAWTLETLGRAHEVIELAACLYQLGRGVDMAWATGEIVSDADLAARLAEHRGTLHHPCGGESNHVLACPVVGSLDSLSRRFQAATRRLRAEVIGNTERFLFAQPPKPRFREVGYDEPDHRRVYELRDREQNGKLWPWRAAKVVLLVERLRDAAIERLIDAFPDQRQVIEESLGGTRDAMTSARVRITPLPSIGHQHVDHAVRRIVLDVPSACQLRSSDVHWAFEGLEIFDPSTGVVGPFVLTSSSDREMLAHYGSEISSRRWRSITPVALPVEARRRRIEPTLQREQAKPASERLLEEKRAASAIGAALRHAGLRNRIVDVAVQREPFEPRGSRAEAFAAGSRFAKEQLWHVELELAEPARGLLQLGDGRFLGLGLMAPLSEALGVFGFKIVSNSPLDAESLVRALRRAVMSRVQAAIGTRTLGPYFSGHEQDGTPARGPHIALQLDPASRRLLIITPHVLERRAATQVERGWSSTLDRALDGFDDLRAGRAGRFELQRCTTSEVAEYTTNSKLWRSVRPYSVTRHHKVSSAKQAVIDDVILECERRRLPRPHVEVLAIRSHPGRGLEGDLRLEFAVAVGGPLALGRTRYLGGGLFRQADLTSQKHRE